MDLTLTILGYVLAVVLFAAFIAAWFGPAAWAIGDAQKRGQSGGVVVLLFWLFGPFSALVWLLTRPRSTLVERPREAYTNADDAIAAAAHLDTLGDWDAAMALYQDAGNRWPEHGAYLARCIQE